MVESSLVIEKNIFLVNDVEKFILVRNNTAVSIQKALSPVIKKEAFESKLVSRGQAIDGVIGMLEAKDTNFLMVIDQSKLIGTIMGNRIFEVTAISFHSYSTSPVSKEDSSYISQIQAFYKRNTLYFSPTLDLSQSFYSVAKNKDNQKLNDSNLFKYSNINSVWNHSNTRFLDNENLIGFIHPIINGYIGIKLVGAYETEFTYCVISRKDTRRSGCRFLVRGADQTGNVANFAETEQILIINDNTSNEYTLLSYLQIRGSIPLIWNQLPFLQLNPPIIPSNDYNIHSIAYNRHIFNITQTYDKVTIVNLIDKKGDQLVIGDLYQNLYTNYKNSHQNPSENLVEFTWFDFHKECSKMKYDQIGKLLKANCVSSALTSQDFSHLIYSKKSEKNPKILTRQKGVFRTNCIDNLDRTNVVQSVLSRQFLHKMLYRIKLAEMPHGEAFEKFSEGFEGIYREFWADNGDYLSKAYSGTNALKRDFTRKGKRTYSGALEDGVNTCTRFYINNFCDGYNQDCNDYFLGLLNPKKKNFKKHSTDVVNFLLVAVVLLVIFLYQISISFSFPNEYENTYSRMLLKMLIFFGILMMSFLSLMNGFKNTIIDLSTLSYH
jgi:phosphatidylinositol 4-phosphatase